MVGAFLVAFFETFGGGFLIIGLVTRFWAAGLAFAMLIAVVLVHLQERHVCRGWLPVGPVVDGVFFGLDV